MAYNNGAYKDTKQINIPQNYDNNINVLCFIKLTSPLSLVPWTF